MTLTRVPDAFTLKQRDDGTYADKEGRSIALPGKPYMAIRLRRFK
jgi:hypothetical protein